MDRTKSNASASLLPCLVPLIQLIFAEKQKENAKCITLELLFFVGFIDYNFLSKQMDGRFVDTGRKFRGLDSLSSHFLQIQCDEGGVHR